MPYLGTFGLEFEKALKEFEKFVISKIITLSTFLKMSL